MTVWMILRGQLSTAEICTIHALDQVLSSMALFMVRASDFTGGSICVKGGLSMAATLGLGDLLQNDRARPYFVAYFAQGHCAKWGLATRDFAVCTLQYQYVHYNTRYRYFRLHIISVCQPKQVSFKYWRHKWNIHITIVLGVVLALSSWALLSSSLFETSFLFLEVIVA